MDQLPADGTELSEMSPPNKCWIQTHTGQRFHPFDPKPSEICLEDIAHALAHIPRWSGHMRITAPYFYSVAQHSYNVGKLVWYMTDARRTVPWALLHDAAEAYVGDMASPIKAHMPAYKQMEKRIAEVIRHKYNVPYGNSIEADVRLADMYMLIVEADMLLNDPSLVHSWTREDGREPPSMDRCKHAHSLMPPNDGLEMQPWTLAEAKQRLQREFALWID